MKHEFDHKKAYNEIIEFLYDPAGSSKMWQWSRFDFVVLILRMIVYLYEQIQKGEKIS